ncbi:MAG: FG-GAP-like repeat-containing protein [Tannerellaceae bacterium]|nr:FG-GAP-like repeat-containing protein [Tannerellaceae bacterium]
MNQFKQWYIIFLAMMWMGSPENLGAQSVQYQYDAAGNRTKRVVGAASPLNSPGGRASFSPDSLAPPPGGGREGELQYEVGLLPEGINGAVHNAIFLPGPEEEGQMAAVSAVPASFASVPNSVEIDRKKAVGEIPLTSEVSNGAAIYTIPIEIYPGRHGFQPEISLTYNSQSGNGVAGYGWHIGGLSAITPIHSTYYYDGEAAEAEKLGKGAAYSMDGMRLIRRSAGMYETEQGFVKANMPEQDNKYFFTVAYPDQRTATYGEENATTPQLSYPLTMLSDKAGNFITFTYKKVENLYLVQEISYGHRTTIIGKIKFTYNTRTDGITQYKAGNAFKTGHLLSKVEVYYDNNLLRTYTLEHTLNEYQFLSKVHCKAGTRELNPLTFYYGTGTVPSPSLSESTSFLSSYFPAGSVKNILHKFKHNNLVVQEGLVSYPEFKTYGILSTDKNGNCSYGSLYSSTQKLLVYSNLAGSLISPTILPAGEGFQGLYPADVDGDGKDELVRINYFYNSGSTSRLQLTTYNQSMSGTTRTLDLTGRLQEGSLNSPLPRAFLTGNFTGDGRATMVAVSGNKTPKNVTATSTYVTLIDIKSGAVLSNTQPFTYDHFKDAVFAMDFTGDGRTELCLVNGSGLHIYACRDKKFTKLTTYTGINSSDLRTSEKKLLLGDLNGDGKTDIILSPKYNPFTTTRTERHNGACNGCCRSGSLVSQSDTHRQYKCLPGSSSQYDAYCYIQFFDTKTYNSDAFNWKIFTSTGTGFSASTVTYDFTNEEDNSFVLQDVNGDQLPDLVVKNGSRLSVYLNTKGNISTTASASRTVDSKAYVIPAISSGSWWSDNRLSRLLAIKDATVSSITYSRNDGLQRKLSGAVNSLGVISKIRYQPMSDPAVYTANASPSLPYNTIFMNDLLVSQQEIWHNNKQVKHVRYTYENGTVHRQGLGFCGFRKITATDQIGPANTVTTYDPAYNGMVTSVETRTARSSFSYTRSTDAYKFLTLRMATKTETDKLNNVIVSSSYQYDSYNNVTSEVIRYGTAETVTVTNKYNNSPRLGELYEQTVKTVRGGDEWTTRLYISSFDPTTRHPKTVKQYAGGNQVKETIHTYDRGDRVQTVEKPYAATQSLTTKYEYDAYGRLTNETSPLNQATTYTYHTKTGELATIMNHKNKQISYEYDAFNRLTKTTYPDATVEKSEMSWETAPAGATYLITRTVTGQPTGRVYYDAFHREIRNGSITFDGKYLYTDYQYDTRGRLWKESQPFRGSGPTAWTTYGYYTYDRPARVETPSGNVQTWAYSAGQVTILAHDGYRTQTIDAAGKLLSIVDVAGTFTYTTRPDGQLTSVVASFNGDARVIPAGLPLPGKPEPEVTLTSFGYDSYGRRESFTDASFGVTRYTYNAAGLIATETDANNQKTEYTYDDYLRVKTKKMPGLTVSYAYNSDGLLSQESTDKNTSTVYTYDDLFRLTAIRENVPDSKWLQKDLVYSGGNVSSVKYTSHTGVIGTENRTYANGHLTERKLGSTSFFKLTAQNDLGQPTTVTTGGVTRTYGYSANGVLNARSAKSSSATFQNFTYSINATKGNLTSRKDSKYNKTESFEYDYLNRLTKYGTQTITLDMKGNILSKSDVGTLSYATTGKPYAVSQASGITNAIPQRAQTVTYTSFGRPATITENNYTATFSYNGNYDRVKMHLVKGTARELTRYYIGGCYEIDETGSSNVKQKLYIGGDYYSAPAVYIKENSGAWQLYNICRDHLGSITHLINSSGSTVTQELSFDAWGRLRNPSTQATYAPGAEPAMFLGRGYTGHEHLPWFGLVNMNARLYDPALGRFLAPDPHIQDPARSQNYNRYAYAMNNPLVYTDPDGEFLWFIPVIIGAVVGAYTGASIQSRTAAFWNWSSDSWKGALAGAFIGAAAGGMFSAAMGASGMTTTIINPLYTGPQTVATHAWGITGTVLNSASLNIGINALSGGGWDGAWKAGLTGAAAGAWGATGGFGMVKGFGSANKIVQMGGKLGYQMTGTVGSSVGNNWASGKSPFSKVTLGVGPVNLTLGKGQKLLQWQNNLGNIATNAVGLSSLAYGGKVSFDWRNLSLNYEGGVVDKFFPSSSGYGAHAVFTHDFTDLDTYKHELHHLWQSRSFGDVFLLNYALQGINAELLGNGCSFLIAGNYFEDQAYHNYWW